jgi:hypothetical protein
VRRTPTASRGKKGRKPMTDVWQQLACTAKVTTYGAGPIRPSRKKERWIERRKTRRTCREPVTAMCRRCQGEKVRESLTRYCWPHKALANDERARWRRHNHQPNVSRRPGWPLWPRRRARHGLATSAGRPCAPLKPPRRAPHGEEDKSPVVGESGGGHAG